MSTCNGPGGIHAGRAYAASRAEEGHGSSPVQNLMAQLAAAEKRLHDGSSSSGSPETQDSEDRDMAVLAQRIEDELESRSNASSGGDEGDAADLTARHRLCSVKLGSRDIRATRATSVEPSTQSDSSSSSRKYSSSGSSGSDQTESEELLLLTLRQVEKEKEALQNHNEAIAIKHTGEIQALQELLAGAKNKARMDQQDVTALLLKLSKAEKHHAAEFSRVNEKLVVSKAAHEATKDERNGLEDRMAGMEARHQVQVDRLKHKLQAEKEEQEAKDAAACHANENIVEQTNSEVAVVMKQLAKAREDFKVAVAERDVLRRGAAGSKNLEAHLGILKERLAVATTELDRRHAQDMEARADGRGRARSNGRKEREAFGELQRLLHASQSKEEEASKENRELRLQVRGLKEGHAEEVGNLQAQLETANVRATAKSRAARTAGRTSRARTGTRTPMAPWKLGLDAIDEESDTLSGDGSVTASCRGSSEADGDGVGDLDDFADGTAARAKDLAEISRLRAEMEQESLEQDRLREELAIRDAENGSKIARLRASAEQGNRGAEEKDEEIAGLKQLLAGGCDKREQQHHREELEVQVQGQKGQKQLDGTDVGGAPADLAQLQHELLVARAAQRSAEARSEDLRAAMQALEARHAWEVGDLRRQLLSLKRPGLAGEAWAGQQDKAAELEEKVRALTEERNVLHNELEWRAVQWRDTIDSLKQQTAAEVAQMRRECDVKVAETRREREVKEAELRACLGEEACRLKVRVAELMEELDRLKKAAGQGVEPLDIVICDCQVGDSLAAASPVELAEPALSAKRTFHFGCSA